VKKTPRLKRGSSEEDFSRGLSKGDSRGSSDEDFNRRLSKEGRPVLPSGKMPYDISPVIV